MRKQLLLTGIIHLANITFLSSGNNMNVITPAPIVLDPTVSDPNPLLFTLFAHQSVVKNDSSVNLDNATRVISTHSFFRFQKPERTSKKGIQKAASTHIAVFDVEPLGAGSFGSVHQVKGTWKLEGSTWTFKTKSAEKRRVVKTNMMKSSYEATPAEILKSYKLEHQFGKEVTHLSFKYPPSHYGTLAFVLMRELKGVTLETYREHLLEDPNYLSVTQRLQITVSLLKALEEQIHSRTIRVGANQAYLVHGDIKPANVMINDWQAQYFDLGLAKLSINKDVNLSGTREFLDPYICSRYPHEPPAYIDGVSDLASLARVIAELWGDRSRDLYTTTPLLHHCNRNNVLEGLFKRIADLSDEERTTIEQTIKQMTSFAHAQRLSLHNALSIFQKLLADRLIKEDEVEQKNAKSTPLNMLYAPDMLDILQGKHADTLIERFANEPTQIPLLFQVMKRDLLLVKEPVLLKLQQIGLDFSTPPLSVKQIKEEHYTAEEIALLMRLGKPLQDDILEEWINDYSISEDEYHWATICRFLYNESTNADDVLARLAHRHPPLSFPAMFCNRFLANKKSGDDDRSNVRLLIRHIDIVHQHNQHLDNIQRRLSIHLPGTTLANAILESGVQKTDCDYIFLVPQPYFESIDKQLDQFTKIVAATNRFKQFDHMPCRKNFIASIDEDIQNRKNLQHMTWELALYNLGELQQKVTQVNELDKLASALIQTCDDEEVTQCILAQLDTAYILDEVQLRIVRGRMAAINDSITLLKRVKQLQTQMTAEGNAFPVNARIEQQLIEFRKSVRLDKVGDTLTQANLFHQLYTRAQQSYKQLNTLITRSALNNRCREALYLAVKRELNLKLATASVHAGEVDDLFLAVDNFSSAEKIVAKRLALFPRVSWYLHQVMSEKLSDLHFSAIDLLSTRLSVAMQFNLFDNDLITKVDLFAQCYSRIEDHETYDYLEQQVKQVLWDFLTCSTHYQPEHKNQMNAQMNQLLDEVKTLSNYSYLEQISSSCTIC